MRFTVKTLAVAAAVAAIGMGVQGPVASARAPLAPESIAARKHFFGAENIQADGRPLPGRVVLSWFSVGSFAAILDGQVVLLDSYIHKGEDEPNYVPTTTDELIALRPAAIFLGHGHFDHAKNAGVIAARTGAVVIGTPEHCDQARAEAAGEPGGATAVRCIEAVSRGSQPGTEVNNLAPLGPSVAVLALKHVHSDTVAPDGDNHETVFTGPPLADPNAVLLHPPGPSILPGLNPSGDEGGTLLYRFQIGDFALVWHDSAGPMREQAPHLFDVLRSLPPADVEVGAVLGFNEPTNGVRDPVDYIATLEPKVFIPNHHDFVAEYGSGRAFEGAVRRELAKRGPVTTDIRWINDPFDYLRPGLASFDVGDPAWADGGVAPALARRECLPRRARTSGRRMIGRLAVGSTRAQLARRTGARPVRVGPRSAAWCVRGSSGRMTAVFAGPKPSERARLVATTSPTHRTRTIGAGSSMRALRERFPRARRVARGAFQAFPGSRRVFATRSGRVTAIAVVSVGTLRDRRALAADLREAVRGWAARAGAHVRRGTRGAGGAARAQSSRKAMGVRVDVHRTAAGEPAEREAAVERQIHGQGGGCADSHEDRRAGHRGLLHELERDSPGHAEDRFAQRDAPFPQRPPDDLVHRVVPPDVLVQRDRPAVRVEQAGRVHAPGRLEARLAQAVGERRDEAARHFSKDGTWNRL